MNTGYEATALMAGPGEHRKGRSRKQNNNSCSPCSPGGVALHGGLCKRGLHGGSGKAVGEGSGRAGDEGVGGWQGNGRRAHHVQEERKYQEDHLGGKYPGGEPERYQYALELRPNTCRDG